MQRLRVPRDDDYIDQCLVDIDTSDMSDELRSILRNIIIQLCMEYGSVRVARMCENISAVTGVYVFRFKLETDVNQHTLNAVLQQSPTAVMDILVSPCTSGSISAEPSASLMLNMDVFLTRNPSYTHDAVGPDEIGDARLNAAVVHGRSFLTVADQKIVDCVVESIDKTCTTVPLCVYAVVPSSKGKAGYYTLTVDGLDFVNSRILRAVCASAPSHIETVSIGGVVGYPNSMEFVNADQIGAPFTSQPNISMTLHIRECLTKPHVLNVSPGSNVLGKRTGQFLDVYYTDTDADLGLEHCKRQKSQEPVVDAREKSARRGRAVKSRTGGK